MRAEMERRAFLAGVAALGGTAWLPSQSKAQSTKTRLILLGTGGGPRPRKANSASARRRELPSWPILALLGLTCAGVLLLVLVRVLGW